MIIKIGSKEYVGQCNALSYIFHKRIFNINVLDEIENIKNSLKKLIENKEINNFNDSILRIIYTLIYTANKNIENFDAWKNEIENEIISERTINDIIEILIKSFIDVEVNNELKKIIKKEENMKSKFVEHEFLATCLKFGLTIKDLRELTYIDILKIFISTVSTDKEERYRRATQEDWDKLAALR